MTDFDYKNNFSIISNREEEVQLKALFLSCDSNNDGKLDRADLITMCTKLNMQDCADEIICTLGTNMKGSTISFDEFLKCRAKVLQVVETCHSGAEYLNYFGTTQYEQAKDSCSDLSQIYSSADYDSGTQDTQDESLSLVAMVHQYYPELYNQWGASRSNDVLCQQMLKCADLIHITRVNKLHTELKLASKRISIANASRDVCQGEISRTQKERDKWKMELQNQSSRYEDRLTELHSVIAELQKKIERRDRNIIREEDEEDGNNVDDYENTDLHKVTSWNDRMQRSSTGSLLDNVTGSFDRNVMIESCQSLTTNTESQTELTMRTESRVASIQKDDQTHERMQHVTEKQLKSFQNNNLFLQEKLSGYENVVTNLRAQLVGAVGEKEILRKQVYDLQQDTDLSNMPHSLYPQISSSSSVSKMSLDSKSTNSSSSSAAKPMMGVRQQSKQMHMKGQLVEPDWVTQVVRKYQKSVPKCGANNVTIQSLISHYISEETSLVQASGQMFLQELMDHVPYPSMTDPLRRIHLEWQRMVAVSDRDSSDKLLLDRTLAEAKSICDQLQCSVVQLQSDCAALTKCNILADQIIELADITIQLQETDPVNVVLDIGIQSSCQEQSCGHSSFVSTNKYHQHHSCNNSQPRNGYRDQLERAAKLFLYRLECYSSMGRQTPDSGAGVSSTLSSGVGSVDVEGVLRQASCSADWCKNDEVKLKRLLEQLISERSRGRLCVAGTHLGQSFYGQGPGSSNQSSLRRKQGDLASGGDLDSSSSCGHQQLIENAILVQEVCLLKEERATLKTSIYLLEKEIRSLQISLDSRISVEKSMKVQLDQMMKHRSVGSTTPSSEECRLLKTQVNDLLQVLEELQERCQLQQLQNEEFVNDLKRANCALIAAFGKAKKKYQAKISRLEQQVANIPRVGAVVASDETAL